MLLGWNPYQHIRLFTSLHPTPPRFSSTSHDLWFVSPMGSNGKGVFFISHDPGSLKYSSFLISCWGFPFIWIFFPISLDLKVQWMTHCRMLWTKCFLIHSHSHPDNLLANCHSKIEVFLLERQVNFWKYLSTYRPLAFMSSCDVCSTMHSHLLEKPTHASPCLLFCTHRSRYDGPSVKPRRLQKR